MADNKVYMVLEGGGVDYDLKVHGIFTNLGQAKECLKQTILTFIQDICLPKDKNTVDTTLVDKQVFENYTYFYVYADEYERDYGAYLNCFALYEGESNV